LGGQFGNPTLNFGAGAGGSGSFLVTSAIGQMTGNVPAGVSVNLQPNTPGPLNATFTAAGPFTNSGSFILSSAGSDNGVILNLTGPPTMTNAGALTVNPGPTSDGVRQINATVVNQSGASVNINASTTLASNGNFSNSGTVNIAAGKT